MVVLFPCLLSSIYYYHFHHVSSFADVQMSISSRGKKESDSRSRSSYHFHHTATSGSQCAPSSPALYDLTGLGSLPNSSNTQIKTGTAAFNSFKYNEKFNLTSPEQMRKMTQLTPSPLLDSSPSKASYNQSSSRQPFYSPLSHTPVSPLGGHNTGTSVPQWHTYHSSPPVQDFKNSLSPGRTSTSSIGSVPLDGGKIPSLLNDMIKRIAARQGVARVDTSSTLLSNPSVDQVASLSTETQQLQELGKMSVSMISLYCV